ncbi:MAG: hypothetical protein KAS39_04590, partial [Actinomycetia bacterium]|nr:hypothetical protein [Actinomycetes bacterium]
MKKSRINILFCGPYPVKDSSFGGIESHISLLSKHLQKSDELDISLLTLHEVEKSEKKNGVKIFTVKKNGFPFPINVLIDNINIRKRIRLLNPDILHIHTTY